MAEVGALEDSIFQNVDTRHTRCRELVRKVDKSSQSPSGVSVLRILVKVQL